jgi:hypothetical protein
MQDRDYHSITRKPDNDNVILLDSGSEAGMTEPTTQDSSSPQGFGVSASPE